MRDPEPANVANPRLGEEEIAALSPLGERRRLHDGEALFQAGGRRGGFYIVLEGAIEVLDRSGDEPRTITTHGPRQFTGDIDVLTRRRPVVGAVARGETEVLGVSSSDVRRIISERPRLGETILRAFIARREELLDSGFGGLRVVGSGSSRETFRLREFLSRNQVPFTWIDVDEEQGISDFLTDLGVGEEDLPVVVADGLALMRKPSIGELADRLGVTAGSLQSVDHGLHIETGAPHQHGPSASALDLGHRVEHDLLELGQGELFVGVDQVYAVVGNLSLLGGAGFGGADIHASVHLHGVDRDQLGGGVRPGQGQREGRLPRCGGTHDRHGLAGFDTEGDAAQRLTFPARVAELDVAELEQPGGSRHLDGEGAHPLHRVGRHVRDGVQRRSGQPDPDTVAVPLDRGDAGVLSESDDELDAYIRASCYVAQHPTSTCAMGMGERSVVDPELRVIGVEGLRVVDASVMPTVPGGNTNLPCIMIGEKAADLIRGRSLPRAELERAA